MTRMALTSISSSSKLLERKVLSAETARTSTMISCAGVVEPKQSSNPNAIGFFDIIAGVVHDAPSLSNLAPTPFRAQLEGI